MSFLVDKQGKEIPGTESEHKAKVLGSRGFTCGRVMGEGRGLIRGLCVPHCRASPRGRCLRLQLNHQLFWSRSPSGGLLVPRTPCSGSFSNELLCQPNPRPYVCSHNAILSRPLQAADRLRAEAAGNPPQPQR